MLVIKQFADSTIGTTGWQHYLYVIPQLMFECHQLLAILLSIRANFASYKISSCNTIIGTIAPIEGQEIGPASDFEDAMNALPVKAKADYFLHQRSIE